MFIHLQLVWQVTVINEMIHEDFKKFGGVSAKYKWLQGSTIQYPTNASISLLHIMNPPCD
jgi:hypothetical protein